MARVTVEDCLQNVKNRFELVMLASKRARQLMRGSAEPKVAWENDKATVVALREIAMGYTDFSDAHHAEIVPRATAPEIILTDADAADDTDLSDISDITETDTTVTVELITEIDPETTDNIENNTDTTEASAPETSTSTSNPAESE